jgi:hypothetical protein
VHQSSARKPPAFPDAAAATSVGSTNDNDIDPAATEEGGGAGADHAAAADHEAHGFSVEEQAKYG